MITSLDFPTEVLKDYNLTLPEFYYLLFRAQGGNPEIIDKVLLDKDIGNVTEHNPNKLFLARGEHVFLDKIITTIKNRQEMERQRIALDKELIPLAGKLQELYPTGTRPGCSQQWRGSKLIIAKKLTSLRDIYGITFTEEEAIDATKRYIASFNGDYHYMECLEYFILRLRPEFKTNFAAWLENKDGGPNTGNHGDYMTKMR